MGVDVPEGGAAGRGLDRVRRIVGLIAAPPAAWRGGADARASFWDDSGGCSTGAWGSVSEACHCSDCVSSSGAAGGMGWPHSLQYS